MTNLEAIRILSRNRDMMGEYGGEDGEALDLAIKALEEQDDASYDQGWADGYAYGIGGEDD